MIAIPRTADYRKYADKVREDDTPCAICGRAINPNHILYIRTYAGGSLVTEEELQTLDPSGDTGCYPIGKNCLRNNPSVAPYVVKIDYCEE